MELARINHSRIQLLREALGEAGMRPVFSGPVFNEQAFEVGDAEAVVTKLARRGIVAGVPLSRWFPGEPWSRGALLCAATELHTPELIRLFAQTVRE